MKKPVSKDYPDTLDHIGDHIRKVRLDKGLGQREVADFIGVCKDSITGWEKHRHTPPVSKMLRIVSFLGYDPDTLIVGNKRM